MSYLFLLQLVSAPADGAGTGTLLLPPTGHLGAVPVKRIAHHVGDSPLDPRPIQRDRSLLLSPLPTGRNYCRNGIGLPLTTEWW
jgi:hypothetical protein